MPDALPHQHHQAAIARGAQCLQCPLYNCGQGPVMPIVTPRATLTVVGEAPGMTEVEEGRIFAGGAGEVVYEALLQGGLSRQQLTMTNAQLCRPPGGHMLDYAATLKVAHRKLVARCKAAGDEAPPLVTPQMCCAPRLLRDIEESGAKVLLALGTEGLKAVAHAAKLPYGATKVPPGTPRIAVLKKQHGSPVLVPDGRVVTCAMHPAFALYGSSVYLPVIREDIQRAATIAKRGGLIDWTEPEFILKPSIDTCINVMRKMQESGALVTVDIETDGIVVRQAQIRCVGLGAVVDGRELLICVPLRHMDGRAWWRPGDEHRLIQALSELLNTAPLNGHNLSFDTAVLINRGALRAQGAKLAMDTMIASHDTNRSELPHDLGFVAAREFEAPHWKDDADHKNVENVDDYTLHAYCLRDVAATMRLVSPLLQQMEEQNTLRQFQTDMTLLPTARDMGDLGLVINEARRRKFFDILDAAVGQRAAELKKLTGLPDFNPNAFKQVSKFLYITKGLSPPYATDGREWEELADEDEELPIDTEDPEEILAHAATNEQSLLRLLELGVDDHTRQFIEAQLSYRGLQKCQSTQVGLKWETNKEGQRVLLDKHRKRGIIQTDSYGDFTGSVLHPSYKQQVVPTGRWAASPNVMAWPENIVWDVARYRAALAEGYGQKKPFDQDGVHGIINTRAMVVAPPGYTLVGADFCAVELRLYAIQAQDALLLDAIYTGKDPHALNYATMMSRFPGEVMTWYARVLNSPVKKSLRNIAKRFFFLCLASGSLVLTKRGEVPIEEVRNTDLLWDGVEWVAHEGVIYKGEAEVLYHDGLWATEEHEVWVEDGRKLAHGRAAAEGLRGLRTCEGRQPRQWLEGHEGPLARNARAAAHSCPLSTMSENTGTAIIQPSHTQSAAVSHVSYSNTPGNAPMAVQPLQCSAATLPEPQKYGLEVLRGPGHQVRIQECRCGDTMGAGALETDERLNARSHRQCARLRAGEHSLCAYAYQHLQSFEFQAARVMELPAGGMAVREETRRKAIALRADAQADPQACCACHDTRNAQQNVAANRRVVRVYDILNAGPRRRFTVSNRLVSNCAYGGQKDKLYATMAADRNPDGSRSFPDLKPNDCAVWFDNLHRAHPEMKRWQDSVVRAWTTHGFVASLIDGRKRFFLGGVDQCAMPNHVIQGCQPADSGVMTSEGYQTIGSLRGREHMLMAWTGIRFAPFRVLPMGTDERLNVTLSNGLKFSCDTRHRLWTKRDGVWGWQNILNIRPEERVAVQLAQPIEYGTGLDSEDAYWLGYFIGNGWAGTARNTTRGRPRGIKRSVTFTIGDREHLPRDAQVNALLSYLKRRGLTAGKVQQHEFNLKSCKSVPLHSTAALDFFTRIGVTPNLTAHTKRVPQTVWKATIAARKQFLRGYLDADGALNGGNYANITVNSPNRPLLQDVLLLCQTVGVDGSISGPYSNKLGQPSHHLLLYRGLVWDVLQRGRAARLTHAGAACTADEVPLLKTLKFAHKTSPRVMQDRVRDGGIIGAYQAQKLGAPPKYNAVQIAKIERTGSIEPMYTLSVDDPEHRYIATSVVSKNSAAAIENRAMIAIAKACPHRGWGPMAGPILQVHDFIGLQVPTARAEEAAELLRTAMPWSHNGMKFDVEQKQGQSWDVI